ncbi:MAG: ankyrin repeat domain-containing protein [Sumerlaeia bacterium]
MPPDPQALLDYFDACRLGDIGGIRAALAAGLGLEVDFSLRAEHNLPDPPRCGPLRSPGSPYLFPATPLMVAMRFDQRLAAEYLLDQGASTRTTNRQGRTWLHLFAWGGKAWHVALLMDHPRSALGVDDYSGQIEQETPLFCACFHQNEAACRELLARGADPNRFQRIEGTDYRFNALHQAARHARLGVVEMLLAHGADPNQRTLPPLQNPSSVFENGRFTALHLALLPKSIYKRGQDGAARDTLDTIRALLRAGADPALTCECQLPVNERFDGLTPYDFEVARRRELDEEFGPRAVTSGWFVRNPPEVLELLRVKSGSKIATD